MNDVHDTYAALIGRFLARELTAGRFQRTFLRQFKLEARIVDPPLFLLLDELFGDVDSYTKDAALLADAPDFYLDEAGLRLKAEEVLRRMTAQALRDPARPPAQTHASVLK
ncbi:colicin immunity domain-containing protein [Rugamonas sp.]|uniref:colicin immunity domain-containing protein n=1 Tax=Rugamonas sp. TaxID=1926287 RepID=UPI0025EDC66A|nr:colicin immunity domain-containing protein [Rugamonas sp.]